MSETGFKAVGDPLRVDSGEDALENPLKNFNAEAWREFVREPGLLHELLLQAR